MDKDDYIKALEDRVDQLEKIMYQLIEEVERIVTKGLDNESSK